MEQCYCERGREMTPEELTQEFIKIFLDQPTPKLGAKRVLALIAPIIAERDELRKKYDSLEQTNRWLVQRRDTLEYDITLLKGIIEDLRGGD